jgi:hypothetical protein
MSGGTVAGNIPGAYSYGREVLAGQRGTFTMSASALPERVFLETDNLSITLAGPLSAGMTFIDLGLSRYMSLTDYVNRRILKPDVSYNGGLTGINTRFRLGVSKLTERPYTETPITGYTISGDGRFVPDKRGI